MEIKNHMRKGLIKNIITISLVWHQMKRICKSVKIKAGIIKVVEINASPESPEMVHKNGIKIHNNKQSKHLVSQKISNSLNSYLNKKHKILVICLKQINHKFMKALQLILQLNLIIQHLFNSNSTTNRKNSSSQKKRSVLCSQVKLT